MELDFDSKTPEELDALMEAQDLPAEAPPQDAPPAEPVPAAESPVESEPAVVKPESDEPTEPAVEQTEKELLLARLELAEEERRKQEQIAGRHGGELGFLRAKVRELEEAVRARNATDDGGMGEPVDTPLPPAPAMPARDNLAKYVVSRAIPDAVHDFEKRHPDAVEMTKPMLEYLNASGFDFEAVKNSTDPLAATQEVDRALSEAYHHARATAKAQRVAELTTKRADQFARLEEAKKKATMSGGGGSSPPPSRPKQIDDMTPDELDAEMRRLNPVY